MAKSLEKRLANLEKQLAAVEEQMALEDCICARTTTVFSREQLRAEQACKCPVHGERRDLFFCVSIAPAAWKSPAPPVENRPPIKTGRYAETLEWKKNRKRAKWGIK